MLLPDALHIRREAGLFEVGLVEGAGAVCEKGRERKVSAASAKRERERVREREREREGIARSHACGEYTSRLESESITGAVFTPTRLPPHQ